MTQTRSFKETVTARVQRDPAFRDALLAEAVDRFLAGEIETGKAVLRDYIDARSASNGVMRRLGPDGDPSATPLFGILRTAQKASGVRPAVAVARRPLG